MVFAACSGTGRVARARLLSRNGRDLGLWFPELAQAALNFPPETLMDGEIVIADQHGAIDFGALQTRLTLARNSILRTAAETCCSRRV